MHSRDLDHTPGATTIAGAGGAAVTGAGAAALAGAAASGVTDSRSERAVPDQPRAVGRQWLRRPAVWTFAGLTVIGCWRVGAILSDAIAAYPRATLVAMVLFALYAVPFLVFIRNLDHLEPEPRPLLAAAFCWGGLVVMATVVPANAAADSLLAKATTPEFAARWGPALVAPTVEEPVKLLGVVMIGLIARGVINSIVDGLVYGAVVGLGFQVVENVIYAANAVATDAGSDQIDPVLTTFVARGVISGLWSHTVFTALAGVGVAVALLRPYRGLPARIAVVVASLAGAWLCHFVWNSPLLTTGLSTLAELLVKGVPPLVLVLVLAKIAGRAEARGYVEQLRRLADPRVATAAEVAALGTASGRSAAQRAARERGGRRAEWATRRLQRAQARLAVELSRHGHDGVDGVVTVTVARAYQQVLVARHRLIAAGLLPEPSRVGGRRPGFVAGLGVCRRLWCAGIRRRGRVRRRR